MRPFLPVLVSIIAAGACSHSTTEGSRRISTSTASLPSTSSTVGAGTTSTTTASRVVYPWDNVKVASDDRSLDVSLSGCLRSFDVESNMDPQRITVTVEMSASTMPATCPPSRETRHIELSEPIGSRAIVDGSFDPGKSIAVGWTKAMAVGGTTLRVTFPDLDCSHIARTNSVENIRAVSVTVFEPVNPAEVNTCSTSLLVRDLPLAAPLGKRQVIDGRSNYVRG